MIEKVLPSQKKITQLYNNMRTRCYNNNFHKGKPTYIDCIVCQEWMDEEHGKERFAEWCCENYYEVDEEVVELDKDILIKGNKTYSPDTCVFAPRSINGMFKGSAKNGNGLPTGVKYCKENGLYLPKVNLRIYPEYVLNAYETSREAWEEYALYRKNEIKLAAEKYFNRIPDKLYDSLIGWEICIDD